MGFSLTGFIVANVFFAPNLLMLVFPPLNVPSGLKDSGVVFTALERIGQVGCLVLLAVSKGIFNGYIHDIWMVLTGVCIVTYYVLWIRYVVAGRDFALLFTFHAIPIPMAVHPILAFAFIAISGKSVLLGSTTIIFAVGHIVNSWNTYRCVR